VLVVIEILVYIYINIYIFVYNIYICIYILGCTNGNQCSLDIYITILIFIDGRGTFKASDDPFT
jgi:hypothetical protein